MTHYIYEIIRNISSLFGFLEVYLLFHSSSKFKHHTRFTHDRSSASTKDIVETLYQIKNHIQITDMNNLEKRQ